LTSEVKTNTEITSSSNTNTNAGQS